MPRKKEEIPEYGTCVRGNNTYYRTRIVDTDGKRVSLYAKTPEELFKKVKEANRLIKDYAYRAQTPTVAEYCDKWLEMQKGRLRETTLTDYRYKIERHIKKPLGNKFMADVTPDDVRMALVGPAQLSGSVYRSVQMLYKLIFSSAEDSNIISRSPCNKIPAKGGKPEKEKRALTDEQVERLLTATKGLPPYVFIMLGLYAGLRREEILGLQWDCVNLDAPAPYLTVKRAWHVEHNRPVILDQLKTPAAYRTVPIPKPLLECLKEEKAKGRSEFVVPNKDGGPMSYTQFQRMWKYVTTRSTGDHAYYTYKNGVRRKVIVHAEYGSVSKNNPHVVHTIDFKVHPHKLRRTYITNLCHATDPKTVQYLAGHEHNRTTMDTYAIVKYNRPEELLPVIDGANLYSQKSES